VIRDSGACFVKSARLSDHSADLVWIGLDPEVLCHSSDFRRLLVDPGLGAESIERLSASGSVVSWSADRVRIRIFPFFVVFRYLVRDPGFSRRNP
jgi:hypothetical protein